MTLSCTIVELHIWRMKLITDNINLYLGLEAFGMCGKDLYINNMHMLIKIYCMLPVSTISLEIFFSTLKRIKNRVKNNVKFFLSLLKL